MTALYSIADNCNTTDTMIRMGWVLSRLNDLHPDMTILQARVFFLIAEQPGITQRDLSAQLSVSDSNVSRVCDLLGSHGARNGTALRLIQPSLCSVDRRIRRMNLSTKGAALMQTILSDLSA